MYRSCASVASRSSSKFSSGCSSRWQVISTCLHLVTCLNTDLLLFLDIFTTEYLILSLRKEDKGGLAEDLCRLEDDYVKKVGIKLNAESKLP